MNIFSYLNRRLQSQIVRRAALMLVVLTWSSVAFCGEIQDAARDGDLEKIKALIKKTPDLVFSKDAAGMTALHWAAIGGRRDVAEVLLADRADVNAKSNDGHTPLYESAGNGSVSVAELLLSDGADVSATSPKYQLTPLHVAAGHGQTNIVKLLLAHKADLGAKTVQGWTPLHLAAIKGQNGAVEALLAAGADASSLDKDGNTPVEDAVLNGQAKVVAALPRCYLSATAGKSLVNFHLLSTLGNGTYGVFRGTTKGAEDPTPVATVTIKSSSGTETALSNKYFSDSGLTNGTTYYYKARLENSNSPLDQSKEVSATPLDTQR